MADTNLSIHKILCPTDFSDFSASALTESVRLARWFGAEVTVVHVIPFALPIAGDIGYVQAAEEEAAAREEALERLQNFVNASKHAGVAIRTVCRQGDPCHEIRELARETGADLVVMGTHGRSGFKRLMLGSVTEAVLNRPPAPVLTVTRELPERKGLFRTVLCAIDVSEWSAGTIAVAEAIADEGAKRLLVLNVMEHPFDASGALERTTLAGLHRLIPGAARRSYRIDERVTFGEPDREIMAVAAEEAADVVVMGTRGAGTLGHLFGSTVRSVVRDAACPVLVVPAGHAWPARDLVRKGNSEVVACRE